VQTLFESAYVTDLSQSMLRRRQLLNISYITPKTRKLTAVWPTNLHPIHDSRPKKAHNTPMTIQDTISFVCLLVRLRDILFISNFIWCSTSVLWVTCVTPDVSSAAFVPWFLFSFYFCGIDNVRSVLITRP